MWNENRITNDGELFLTFTIPKNEKFPNPNDFRQDGDKELEITETRNNYKVFIRKTGFTPNTMDFVLRLNHRRYQFKKPSYDYFSPELDIVHLNNPSKEITESGAAVYWCFKALKSLNQDLIKDPSTICYVIADGTKPKTGLLLLYSTLWNIIVTDPLMKEEWLGNEYDKRLFCSNELSDDLALLSPEKETKMVITIGVHSHANYSDFYKRLRKFYDVPLLLLSIPCCKGFVHTIEELEPLMEVIDNGIFSPKNKLVIYYDE